MIFLYIILILILIFLSFYIVKKNKNDYVVIGSIVGVLYFNVTPFIIFIINNGTIGLNIESKARWAMIPHALDHPDKIINYYIALFFILISIFIYTKIKIFQYKPKQIKNEIISTRTIIIVMILFFVMNIIKDTLIPNNIVHWAEKAHYFNQKYGTSAQIFNFFLTGLKFFLLVVGTNAYSSKSKIAIAVLLLTGIIDVVFSSNRIFSLLVGLVLIIIFIKNKKYFSVLILSVISIPLILFMNLWPYIRSTMAYLPFIETLEKSFKFLADGHDLIMLTIFSMVEGADFLVSYSIIDDFPEKYDFFYGTSLLKIFTFFIPRAIWEEKWDSIAIEMAAIYNPHESGFSLATTLLGEIFANGGYIALLIVPILLLSVLSYTFKILSKVYSKYDYHYLGFAISFLSMRSNFSDAYLLLLSISFFLIFIKLFSKIKT